MISVSNAAGLVCVPLFVLVFAVLVYVFVKILIAISRLPSGNSGSPSVNNNQRDTRERWDSDTKNPWFVNWQEGTLEDKDGNIVGDLDDQDDQ